MQNIFYWNTRTLKQAFSNTSIAFWSEFFSFQKSLHLITTLSHCTTKVRRLNHAVYSLDHISGFFVRVVLINKRRNFFAVCFSRQRITNTHNSVEWKVGRINVWPNISLLSAGCVLGVLRFAWKSPQKRKRGIRADQWGGRTDQRPVRVFCGCALNYIIHEHAVWHLPRNRLAPPATLSIRWKAGRQCAEQISPLFGSRRRVDAQCRRQKARLGNQ